MEKRLDDIDFTERGHGAELREAAKQYFLSLIAEDLENSEDLLFNKCFDSAEDMPLGFIAGYEACLRNHS